MDDRRIAKVNRLMVVGYGEGIERTDSIQGRRHEAGRPVVFVELSRGNEEFCGHAESGRLDRLASLQYSFLETTDRIVFDTLLLPQGNDQNYHLYYACILPSHLSLHIASSSNSKAKKQEGTNRFVLPNQKARAIDCVLLYVGIPQFADW